jgi:hypothetical protein
MRKTPSHHFNYYISNWDQHEGIFLDLMTLYNMFCTSFMINSKFAYVCLYNPIWDFMVVEIKICTDFPPCAWFFSRMRDVTPRVYGPLFELTYSLITILE